MPYRLQQQHQICHVDRADQYATALRAFYALCTHIDHQLRLVIGTLREEGLLDNTILMFTADHGDMLGNHGLWAKRLYYEGSANVPMLLVGAKTQGTGGVPAGEVDSRLVGWQDIMPTLLQLADIEPPSTCDGMSMVGESQRSFLYGECNEDDDATRMVHDGRYKLIYYPAGNFTQLFDLEDDPTELQDISDSPTHQTVRAKLEGWLLESLYGSDLEWVKDGRLVGRPHRDCPPLPNRGLSLQRGIHWPPPPVEEPKDGQTNSGDNEL